MTHKELLELLLENNIEFVVVGGVAMRMYNSPRVTHDIDIADRTLDLDKIILLMYRNSYYLIRDMHEDAVSIALTEDDAERWLERTKAGSISFVMLSIVPQHERVSMDCIDVSSQVDVLFELGIPIMRLKKHARIVRLGELSFRVASIEDLITLKEQRSDKSFTDEEDIRFLENLKEN